MTDLSSPTVSVIVPLCNAKPFLPRCLDSVVNQSLKNLEVLLVDDGSTDGSGELCDHYAQKIPIFRIFHTENRGPSAARNTGILAAQGKFLFFLDADDTIEPATLETLASAAEQQNSDLVIGDFKLLNGIRNLRTQKFFFPDNQYFSRAELLELIIDYLKTPRGASIFTNVWGKLYRNSLIQEHSIRFREELRTWEDVVFNFDYLKYTNTIYYIHNQFYNYDIHPEQVTTGTNVFRAPLGFKTVLQSIRSILQSEAIPYADINNSCYHAAAYFAIKTLIVCAVLRERGKCDSNINSQTVSSIIRILANDEEVQIGLHNYDRSPGESILLPFLMRKKYYKLAEFVCRLKARKILRGEKRDGQ